MIKRTASAVITVALLVGGIAAMATGAAGQQGQDGQQAKRGGRGPGVAGRASGAREAIHGEMIVRDAGGSGWREVVMDRGKVVSKTASGLTLERPDGQRVTVAVDGSTRYRGVESLSAVQEGRPAMVVANQSGTALVVTQRPPDAQQHRQRGDRRQGQRSQRGARQQPQA